MIWGILVKDEATSRAITLAAANDELGGELGATRTAFTMPAHHARRGEALRHGKSAMNTRCAWNREI